MIARTRLLARCTGCTTARSAAAARTAMSTWSDVPMGPPDPIMGLTDRFNEDTFPQKVSVGVGAYRDDDGKPYILPSVIAAEERLLAQKVNHEYAGIAGIAAFTQLSLEFGYGKDSAALAAGRIAAVQTLSGTGSLRLAGMFYERFLGAGTPMYLPDPTWGNHIPIFKQSGLDVRTYKYYDPDTVSVDFQGMLADVAAAPTGSIFLFHSCAHNPTGIDLSIEQWGELSKAVKAAGHHVLMDNAYQGFASGNAEQDAASLRLFVEDGHDLMLCQSYAKNFGLYGERIGALSAVCADPDEAKRVESQLKILIRPLYSNPPIHGALIVKEILSDPALRAQWDDECRGMADRIIEMRALLRSAIEAQGGSRSWNHITDQIGMFCYSGLTADQVKTLQDDYHVYMTNDGRISMAGVNSKNVEYIAEAIGAVTKE